MPKAEQETTKGGGTRDRGTETGNREGRATRQSARVCWVGGRARDIPYLVSKTAEGASFLWPTA